MFFVFQSWLRQNGLMPFTNTAEMGHRRCKEAGFDGDYENVKNYLQMSIMRLIKIGIGSKINHHQNAKINIWKPAIYCKVTSVTLLTIIFIIASEKWSLN